MSNYDKGIVVGFIGGKDYVSQDNGDGTHSLICPIGDVPEIKRNHDRTEKESAELKEELQAKTDLLGLVIAEKAGLEQENSELRNHLNNLIKESTGLTEFKNDTLRRGICSTDLDEPEWHDYQTIGEAAEYLGKLLNK